MEKEVLNQLNQRIGLIEKDIRNGFNRIDSKLDKLVPVKWQLYTGVLLISAVISWLVTLFSNKIQ